MRARTLPLLLCATVALAARAASAAPCQFPAAWVQASLDLWERSTAEVLRRPAAPLPYIVYFDRRCAYHLAAPKAPARSARELPALRFRGAPVRVFALAHRGTIRLPDGQVIRPRPHAAGAVYEAPEPTPYYAMALMDIWRTMLPKDKQGPNLDEEFLTIAQHELTHTLQLRAIYAAAKRLAEAAGKKDFAFDDDAIQDRFENDRAYVAAFDEERKLLFAASLAPDVAEKKRLVRRAVELARARQARWFVGEHALHGQMDGLFLSMEGLGEWVRYALMTSGPVGAMPRQTREQAIALLQGKHPYWSQDEGVAILLVLEQLMPDFRERLLADELPDAFALLDEAAR